MKYELWVLEEINSCINPVVMWRVIFSSANRQSVERYRADVPFAISEIVARFENAWNLKD